MKNDKLKVGICVAYDWALLGYSLPLIYNEVDEICLSLDNERISWSGKKFNWNETGFRKLISDLDIDKKINVFEDDFHLSTLNPMENEVRQRNLMSEYMGVDGWHLQIDADEYFIDFAAFAQFLRTVPDKKARSCNIICPVINLYKINNNSTYYIDYQSQDQIVYHNIATKDPKYEYGRINGKFNIVTNHLILHQSWARPDSEILEKLNNWGHSHDIDLEECYSTWQGISERNFHTKKNFHPVVPQTWPKLNMINIADINQLITHFENRPIFQLSNWELRKRNSKNLSRIKKLLKLH